MKEDHLPFLKCNRKIQVWRTDISISTVESGGSVGRESKSGGQD